MSLRPIRVWGLPLAPLTRSEAVAAIGALIEDRRPSYFVTANLHFAMLAAGDPRLRLVAEQAALVLADGAPLVWASRWRRRPLPERVAGSDLIYDLCCLAASRGYRVFFLGGGPGVADEAARRLRRHAPGLVVAGTECPPFRPLSEQERRDQLDRIREAAPDLLFVASTMPRGEHWIAEHIEQLGVPVAVNVGAAIDFAAGRVRRAPVWVQRIGMEWAWRIGTDPRRLGPRYARNARFLLRMVLADLRRGRRPEPDPAEDRASVLPASPPA
ncbi:WecB/TagA/CpsF family glycosyltransferase [Tautonia sociabilis]|uniref:Glycosyltransferase n=1 Tax=Tautonia sociabilis TaxID=2080755 RepID=A0A432MFH8_9BACT|nr:WecB/TagA/CpsF family glycosyltransferase [Tautonia sociabilis]RUL84920.1 glycosyltransferase [Tautonia sociabilis]